MTIQKSLFSLIPLVLSAVLPACAGTPTTVPATGAPLPTTAPIVSPAAQAEKVRIAYGAPVPAMGLLPFDLATALKLFTQEGLDVTVARMPRLDANNGLVLGQYDLAVEGFNPSDMQMQGKSTQAVTSFSRLPGFALLVKSDLKETTKSVADLKGQKINYGGLPAMFPYIIAKAGLKPGDVQFVEDGRNVAQIEADMEKGVGNAAILVDPYTTQLVQSGKGYVLVDLATEADSIKWLGGGFQSASLIATTDTTKNRPQTVQKMVNALVKSLRYLAAHSPTEIAEILPPEVIGKDKPLFIKALQRNMPIFSKEGLFQESDVKNAIDVYKAMGEIKSDQTINAGMLYTNEFVKNVR